MKLELPLPKFQQFLGSSGITFSGNMRSRPMPQSSAPRSNGPAGNINVDLEYSVKARMHQGRASVDASRLEAASGNSLNVYYMEDDPDQMVPVDVLKSKQRFIIIAAALGTLLTVLGVAFKRRQVPSAAPAPTPASP
jgi:hypothetical protein